MASPSATSTSTTAPSLRPDDQKGGPPADGSLKPGGTTGAAMVVDVVEVDVEVVELEVVLDEVVVRRVVVVARCVVVVDGSVVVVDGSVVVVDGSVVVVGAAVVVVVDSVVEVACASAGTRGPTVIVPTTSTRIATTSARRARIRCSTHTTLDGPLDTRSVDPMPSHLVRGAGPGGATTDGASLERMAAARTHPPGSSLVHEITGVRPTAPAEHAQGGAHRPVQRCHLVAVE